MNILFYLILITCFILLLSSHPVSILTSILIQTFLICVFSWLLLKSSWFSFVLFLIFLGGLMVLFVYVVSLASNEKFTPLSEEITFMTLAATSTMVLSLMFFYFQNKISVQTTVTEFNIMMIFSNNLLVPTLMIMVYLFFVLLVAVKISSQVEAPMRNQI